MSEQEPDEKCRRKHRRDDDSEALALHNAVTALLDASGVVTSRLGRRIRSEVIVIVVKPVAPDPASSFVIRAWERPILPDLINPKGVAGHYPQLVEVLQKQVRDSAASSIADPSWEVLTQKWQTADPGNFAGVSDKVRDLDEDMFRAAMNSIGIPGPVEAALVFVVPLPLSEPLGELAVLGDVLGIAFALATGHALMACASLKSLAHEGIIQLFKNAIDQALDSEQVALRPPAETAPLPDTRAAVPLPEATDSSARTVSGFDAV